MKIFRTKKDRNCFHALRRRFHPKMRSQTQNPAALVVFQLLTLFGWLFARIPAPAPIPSHREYRPPPLSPTTTHRRELAKQYDVPVRYLDMVLALGNVPYSVLFDHIRQGGVLRRDALIELRKRVPVETLEWLTEMEKIDRFSDLLACLSPRKDEADTNVKMLQFVLKSIEEATPFDNLPTNKPICPADGDRPENDDDDPNTPVV